MSAAHTTTGFGQGADTAAVLTNRSKYITIISEQPYFSRHVKHFPSARHQKGTRPMHRTSLTLDVFPKDRTRYISCMKASFSGSKELCPSRRPPAFPSQHTSQFSIGIAPDNYLDTHSRKIFVQHPVKPSSENHEDKTRWRHQMTGSDMMQAIRQEDSNQMDFNTTYKVVHDELGMRRGPGIRRPAHNHFTYDIITGMPLPSAQQEDFRLTSGNRILHNIRQSQERPLVLG